MARLGSRGGEVLGVVLAVAHPRCRDHDDATRYRKWQRVLLLQVGEHHILQESGGGGLMVSRARGPGLYPSYFHVFYLTSRMRV